MKKTSSVSLVGLAVWFMLASNGWAQFPGVVTNISKTQGKWKRYSTVIAANTTQLTVKTSAGSGDVDLYIRYTDRPTTTFYWKRSIQKGNREVIEVKNPPAGKLCIGLRAYQSFSGVTLKVKQKMLVEPDTWRTDMLHRVNYERAKYGQVALRLNTPLVKAAQIHATDMATKKFLSHTGSDGSSYPERIMGQGYNTGYGTWGCAENVVAGQSTAAAVMTSCMNSPEHRDNILRSSYRHFGCGYGKNDASAAKHYWCQTFGYRK